MIFASVFLSSAIAFLLVIMYGMYLLFPPLALVIPILWLLMVVGNKYALRVMISLDQTWQTAMAPFFNLWNHKFKFGNPDETASSVIGKNLQATGATRYRVIEFFLMWLFEGGKPHAIPSIEEDETL